jgi:tRNA(Ile)-lysidine synthase
MPATWVRQGMNYHRPLLRVRSTDIRDWLQHRGVAFIEDPSNVNEQFTRNRIRARLLPALEATFPQFRDTFARSVGHVAQAQQMLLDVAIKDLAVVDSPPEIAKVQRLSRSRQANVLRYWLNITCNTVPSTAQMEELLDQIADCTTRGHQIRIKLGTGFIERRDVALHWYNLPVLL